MKISDAGIRFLKTREGFRAQPYHDTGGVITVGYGHVVRPGEHFDGGISELQATSLLRRDVSRAEGTIDIWVHQPLTQNQYDALVSFVFNIGMNAFIKSTMLRLLNAGKISQAAGEFERWIYDAKRHPVLKSRREAEEKLFTKGEYV